MTGSESESAVRMRKSRQNGNYKIIRSEQCADTGAQCANTYEQCADTGAQCANTYEQCADTGAQCANTYEQCADIGAQCANTYEQCADTGAQCANTYEQCADNLHNVRQRKRKRKSKNNNTDDDRTGENPRAGNNIFWTPNADSDYQCLCDELILFDPHMRPDVEIRVDEERNLIEEMFSSYDNQKVIRAMKKARDNGAKSFTYARKILLEQGQSAYTSPKANKQDLVIQKTNWADFVECVKSDAMREMLEQTPEEYRELILQKTVFYSASEITKTLRIAHIEFDDCFEGVEKVYAYFSYLLKWNNYFFRLAREQQPSSTPEEQEVYSLAKFDQMWGYGSGLLEGY